MVSVKLAGLLAAMIFGAGQARACEITNLLTGNSEAAVVTNHLNNGDTYETYLVRNAARDQNGILSNWIKLELVPQRWGFDLQLPSGRRFAQVNDEAGKWVISASPDFMDACAGHYVTFRKGAASKMDVYDGQKRIGSIERFPFNKLF